MKHDIKPLDIMTRAAFENAMVIVMALGGSTNAVLHLIAMARACGVPLSLDDFQAASDKTPFIADLKPSGKYVMEDVHKVRSCSCLVAVCLLSHAASLYVGGEDVLKRNLKPSGKRLLEGIHKRKCSYRDRCASAECCRDVFLSA